MMNDQQGLSQYHAARYNVDAQPNAGRLASQQGLVDWERWHNDVARMAARELCALQAIPADHDHVSGELYRQTVAERDEARSRASGLGDECGALKTRLDEAHATIGRLTMEARRGKR